MDRLGILALVLALGGCGLMKGDRLSAMTPAQLQNVSNKDLCFPYADSRAIDMERQRRRLVCERNTNDALGPDSPVWGNLMVIGAGMQQPYPAPPQTTTCRRSVGNTVQCTNW